MRGQGRGIEVKAMGEALTLPPSHTGGSTWLSSRHKMLQRQD